MIFVMKAGRHCRKPPLKNTEKDEEETQEAAANLADAKEISVDGAITATVMCFTLKEEERTVLKCLMTPFAPIGGLKLKGFKGKNMAFTLKGLLDCVICVVGYYLM